MNGIFHGLARMAEAPLCVGTASGAFSLAAVLTDMSSPASPQHHLALKGVPYIGAGWQ